jgi:C4-dicarboxylate-specific signal transduction histidine kinase
MLALMFGHHPDRALAYCRGNTSVSSWVAFPWFHSLKSWSLRKTRGGSLAGLLLIALTQIAGVSAASDNTEELERAASYDPVTVLATAKQGLEDSKTRGDNLAQLQDLRLIVMASRNLRDNSHLIADAEQGISLARELGNIDAMVELMTAKAWAMAELSNDKFDAAVRLLDEAITLVQQNHFERTLPKIYLAKAWVYYLLDRTADALALYLQAYGMFEAQDNRLWMSITLDKSTVFRPDFDTEEAKIYLGRAIRALELIDPAVYRSRARDQYYNLGIAYFYLKDYPRAKQNYENCLMLARELHAPIFVAECHYGLGKVALAEHRPTEALAYFDQSLPAHSQAGRTPLRIGTHLGRAMALALLKRTTECLEALSQAHVIWSATRIPTYDAFYYSKVAMVYQQLGDYRQSNRQMELLRDAERRAAQAEKTKLSEELKVRFEVKLKEKENALLRSEQKASRSQWAALMLSSGLGLVLLGGIAVQMRQRSVHLARQLRIEKAERETKLLAVELEAERERRKVQEELVHASKMAAVGRMVAGVNHEIKRPLASMQLLLDNGLALLALGQIELATDNLQIVRQLTDQLGQLCRQLDGFFRKEELPAVSMDLQEVVNSSLAILTPRLNSAGGCHVDVIAGGHLVVADAGRLRLVLVNVLANALDAIVESDDKRVEITAQEEGEHILVRVRDHGPGFSAAALGHLFEPFFTTKSPGDGLGLGLALSAGLVREMGGELTARNHGGGAEFSIKLPRLESNDLQQSCSAPKAASNSLDAVALRPAGIAR